MRNLKNFRQKSDRSVWLLCGRKRVEVTLVRTLRE